MTMSAAALVRRSFRNILVLPRRGLFDTLASEHPQPVILLREADLLPSHDDYLKKINKNDFQPSRVIPVMEGDMWRRLAIVLPVEVNRKTVIPIPFICDTGDPFFMHLGTGAYTELQRLGMIKDVEQTQKYASYKLRGTIYYGDVRIKDPPSYHLGDDYEKGMKGDIRLNLIGLAGMRQLGILNVLGIK